MEITALNSLHSHFVNPKLNERECVTAKINSKFQNDTKEISKEEEQKFSCFIVNV